MIEVLQIYHQKEQTIFKAAFLLDLYYDKKKEKGHMGDLHLTGIVLMLIASKSEEVTPISLTSAIETIGKNRFSSQQIKEKEVEILQTIDFRTSLPSVYELLTCVFRFIKPGSERTTAFFTQNALLLARMCLFEYGMIVTLGITEIAFCCAVISLKLCARVDRFDCDSLVG